MSKRAVMDPSDAPTWPNAPTQPLRRKRRWGKRLLLIVLALALVASVGAGYLLWRVNRTVTSFPSAHFNSGQNAVWLEHSWVGQPHAAADYDALARRLGALQVAYVFAHVGPLESDGTISAERAPYALNLAMALHARLPQLRVLAWIGQLEAASGQPADQVVDLNDSAVRAHISQSAYHAVHTWLFDGVHYDIEPIVNNSQRFLDLLNETRTALPPNSILSVAAQKWAPNATIADAIRTTGRADAWWTSYYYAAVAAHVDQMVAMAYNTGMPTPQLYSMMMKEELQHILIAARSARYPPQVLAGIPTYGGNNTWYHDSAENMQSGLDGVTAGLNSATETQPFIGVAIYRFATTSDAQWATYTRQWLGESGK